MAAVTFMKSYPVEGDSAVAELWWGDEMLGDLRLEGLNLERRGDDRLVGVEIVLTLYPWAKTLRKRLSRLFVGRSSPAWEEVADVLGKAEAWLLENERGREPVGGVQGLSTPRAHGS